MKQKRQSPLGYYTIGIAALFLAGFLLLVIFGAHIYRNAAKNQEHNSQTRSLNSYLATCVRANNSINAVNIEGSEYGQVLVVADGNSGYAFKIYQKDGQLLEDFTSADAPISPDNSQIIGDTEIFEIDKLSDELLSVTTDAGRVLLKTIGNGENR